MNISCTTLRTLRKDCQHEWGLLVICKRGWIKHDVSPSIYLAVLALLPGTPSQEHYLVFTTKHVSFRAL
jgi:hypothetical protein